MIVKVFGLEGIPAIERGDDLIEIIISALDKNQVVLEKNDIICVTEKIVSKSEGRVVNLNDVKPSEEAIKIADRTGKDPRVVELILQESEEIIKVGSSFLITRTKHGFICANAGIDSSNIESGKVKLLPCSPDSSAERIRMGIERKFNIPIGVIIIDSCGRPFRTGSMGMAIGASGIKTLWDRRGEMDMYGNVLKTTRVAVADCLASIAALIFGEGGEKIPVVVIKGLDFSGDGRAVELIRSKEEDLFR